MTNRVINAAAQGLTSRSFHANFQDVNPLKTGEYRGVSYYGMKAKEHIRGADKSRRNLEMALSSGARILEITCKVKG